MLKNLKITITYVRQLLCLLEKVNFTHPIELVKTRMQVTGAGIGETVSIVAKQGGVGSFWKGIAFAWGREASYTTVKLGACTYTYSRALLLVVMLLEMKNALKVYLIFVSQPSLHVVF